jgi:hypothetical protein
MIENLNLTEDQLRTLRRMADLVGGLQESKIKMQYVGPPFAHVLQDGTPQGRQLRFQLFWCELSSDKPGAEDSEAVKESPDAPLGEDQLRTYSDDSADFDSHTAFCQVVRENCLRQLKRTEGYEPEVLEGLLSDVEQLQLAAPIQRQRILELIQMAASGQLDFLREYADVQIGGQWWAFFESLLDGSLLDQIAEEWGAKEAEAAVNGDVPAIGREAPSDARTTPEVDRLRWSEAKPPKEWRKVFKISQATLIRRFEKGIIRHIKETTKSYKIAEDDLPPSYRQKGAPG